VKLVVALGNPGTQYKKTRHNIGFVFLDSYLKDKNIKIKKNIRFNSEIAEIRTNKEKVFFVKPQNYMNNSGESVKKIMDYYNISIDQILILVDDIYLDVLTPLISPPEKYGRVKSPTVLSILGDIVAL
jgi:PTH1 family peptidyl-tRNA hydrolase